MGAGRCAGVPFSFIRRGGDTAKSGDGSGEADGMDFAAGRVEMVELGLASGFAARRLWWGFKQGGLLVSGGSAWAAVELAVTRAAKPWPVLRCAWAARLRHVGAVGSGDGQGSPGLGRAGACWGPGQSTRQEGRRELGPRFLVLQKTDAVSAAFSVATTNMPDYPIRTPRTDGMEQCCCSAHSKLAPASPTVLEFSTTLLG